MTMEQFLMILDEELEYCDGLNQACFLYPYPFGTKLSAFKTISDYRWALRELTVFVENQVGATYEPQAIYKFVEAVVDFEYQMDVYSKVNDKHRSIFINARNIASEVEDILNAML